MTKAKRGLYLRTLGLGAISGLRSMTAPAVLSMDAAHNDTLHLDGNTPLHTLASPGIATALCVAAVGEMIVDKLPQAPNRTIPPSLIFRALSGALVGAALFDSEKESKVTGAALGALAAVAATYGAYSLRHVLNKHQHIADPILGLVEDALAVGSGISLLQA